jgi:hypothetical protein
LTAISGRATLVRFDTTERGRLAVDALVAENVRKRGTCGPGLALVAAVAILIAPAASAAPRQRAVEAAAIVRLLSAGKPVSITRARIEGVLRLPAQVNAPLSLRHCVLTGGISAASTTGSGTPLFAAQRW